MLSPTYFSFFVVFAVIAYLIATDNSVAQFITLLSKIASIKIKEIKWKILNDPRNPIVNWLKRLEYDRIAKELMKEYEENK